PPSHRRKPSAPARCTNGLPTGVDDQETTSPTVLAAHHLSPPITPGQIPSDMPVLAPSCKPSAATDHRTPQPTPEQLEKQLLIQYVTEKTRNPFLDSCSHCLMIFPDPFLALLHSWTHGPAGPYHCSICGLMVPTRCEFIDHIGDP
ncbi:hypothetical protein PFISCL1PPCAC_16519, partial [Pristionchus fissidentatus]